MKSLVFLSQCVASLMLLGLGTSGLARSTDSCDDYLDRHHKADLVAVGLAFKANGSQQDVYLKVKNIGTEPFTFSGPANLRVFIFGLQSNFPVPGNILAGQEVELVSTVD